jgi:rhodanese-related sulfurtransferase
MTNPAPAQEPYPDVAAEAVADSGAVILDCRTDEEWALAHAKGALHWELAKLAAGEFPDLPKDAHVYVHCMAGARAGKAKELLEAAGWTRVKNMGGISDWTRAGGAVER